MKMSQLKKNILKNAVMLTMAAVVTYTPVYAAAAEGDLDTQIQEQQKILSELNAKKINAQNTELANQITDLTKQINDLKNRKNYDAQGAIDAMSAQLASLQEQLANQNQVQSRILKTLDKIDELTAQKNTAPSDNSNYRGTAASRNFLINPGPSEKVSYTQDAINAQGNSTMIFKYSPNQLYKIYCRTGYLTDIALHPGEKVSFVGGGDTGSWAINSSTVDGVAHIYLKPVVPTSTTNLIITTNKRSYQLIVNTSDWYNPMVRWSYDDEDLQAKVNIANHDEKTITDTMNVHGYGSLNFEYEIKGDSSKKPSMVFDDGEKTVIKFKSTPSKAPAIFVRERGKKGVSLVNFKIKDGCYIIERVIDQAEIRFSDTEVVSIKRK